MGTLMKLRRLKETDNMQYLKIINMQECIKNYENAMQYLPDIIDDMNGIVDDLNTVCDNLFIIKPSRNHLGALFFGRYGARHLRPSVLYFPPKLFFRNNLPPLEKGILVLSKSLKDLELICKRMEEGNISSQHINNNYISHCILWLDSEYDTNIKNYRKLVMRPRSYSVEGIDKTRELAENVYIKLNNCIDELRNLLSVAENQKEKTQKILDDIIANL